MKRLLVLLVLVGALVLSACGSSNAGQVEVQEPWARSAMQGENSAIYFMLQNHTNAADELVSASGDIADSVELHKSVMDDKGVMQMIHQDSVPVAANGEVEFAPGGLHIMLIGLKKDLKAGDTFNVTLHFKTNKDITVLVTVKDAANMNMNSGMGGMATPTP